MLCEKTWYLMPLGKLDRKFGESKFLITGGSLVQKCYSLASLSELFIHFRIPFFILDFDLHHELKTKKYDYQKDLDSGRAFHYGLEKPFYRFNTGSEN